MANTRKRSATVRLYLGSQPDPADRKQIVVSREDEAKIPGRNQFGVVTVTNLLNGKKIKLKRISCGLPNCGCALGEVK